MALNIYQQVFFELLRAGLWEKEARLSMYGDIDLMEIYRIAEEQSVAGLVSAGLEHVTDVKLPNQDVLQFVGQALQLEQRNMAMNTFIARLIVQLRTTGVNSLLVKGQGIAQCYEKPLWRACGDVDLFLCDEDYCKAKEFLVPLASTVDEEDVRRKHLGITIESWIVELHGNMYCGISRRADNGMDGIKKDLFEGGNVRSWVCNGTQVFLPNAQNDVIIVFTHILQHFFYGGIGLRQICDWCRLLWTYRQEINHRLLEKRLRKMGLMTEWKAFGALAVDYLGMPVEAMPLYSSSKRWTRKSKRVLEFVLETGNFGQNRDTTYYEKYSFVVYKTISFWKNTWDSMRHLMIFPADAVRVWFYRLFEGVQVASKGK